MKKYIVPQIDVLVIDIKDEVSTDAQMSNARGGTEKVFGFDDYNTIITPVEGSGYNNKGF